MKNAYRFSGPGSLLSKFRHQRFEDQIWILGQIIDVVQAERVTTFFADE